ncbi:hypothetical protein C8N47_102105 [Mangrovibacterium marinum]|uniref:Uncharacterized protein n=1 Tax=Mangrovibacterium marinum TaxID=1639118 RepID=A0A2T5C5D0_9BACT|nr:hypothetical protein C8N47_102105 [Mangrovibacterium marinum]
MDNGNKKPFFLNQSITPEYARSLLFSWYLVTLFLIKLFQTQ